KYYNFFADTIRDVTSIHALPVLNVVLPIGISFYTFHTISYIVDVAAGRVRPARSLFEYLTYVSLFSQLVAGPIVRFRQIEEDLEHIDGGLREDQVARGLGFFVIGMMKKVIIADTLARYVDPMLASYQELSFVGAWLSALGYTFQLYFDFSGYSDMAVGLGYMFGLRIPQNFNAPYRALGIRDFWRRWHISLSSWLRDYLYIPLGGNRNGPVHTHVNLFVTMVLGGLWHGANWTFVLWGAYHGALLILDRFVEPWTSRLPVLLHRWSTFLLVVVGWVIFRAQDMTMARVWLGKMFGFGAEPALIVPSTLLLVLIIVCFIAVNLLPETWDMKFTPQRRWATAYALGLFIVYLFMNGRDSVFLYYQF
ncbi:MAG TPA: MBOAT family O-acyltransferase, partial [Armatimonadota bacterium]